MRVSECNDFNSEFPEQFPHWGAVDSPKLCSLANALVSRINTERLLIPEQRHTMAGCRLALRLIAEIADL